MKRRNMFVTLAVALALVCGLTIGASAADTLKEITANLSYGITVKYNGETQTLKDANGNTVYPISYEGTTYLPIRAVSNMLGISVDWDQATQTVLLGNSAATVNLMETYKPYTPYQSVSLTIADRNRGAIFYQNAATNHEIGGETTSSFLCLWSGPNNSSVYDGCLTSSFNLGGKYSTLTFKAYANKDVTLTVMGDNDSVLGTFDLKGQQIPQTFTVNLENTSQLTFHREPLANPTTTGDLVATYIFDAQLS